MKNDQTIVLHSTPESVAAGKLSVFAVIEVFLSIALYWWIAIRYETHVHLWIGILAAPLILLRSEASVEQARVSWERFASSSNQEPKGVSAYLFPLGCLLLGLMVMHLYAAKTLLIGISGWSLFGLSLIYNLASWIVVFFVVGATIGLGRGAVQEKLETSSTVTIAVTITVAIPFFVTAYVAGWIAFLGAIVALTSMILLQKNPYLASWLQFVVMPGFAVGFWFRTVFIRVASVTSYPLQGARSGAQNWRRIALVEDCTHLPELIPGLPQTSLQRVLGETVNVDRIRIRSAAKSILLVIWFLPAWLWRFSIKSTSWFYFPLLLMTRDGALMDDGARRIRVDRPSPLYDKLSAIYSSIVLVVAVLSLVDWGGALRWSQHLQGDAPFGPVGWLFVTDWVQLSEEPWKWFVLAASVATLAQYVWIDWIRNQRLGARENGFDPNDRHSPGLSLFWIDRFRNLLVILSIVVGIWYFTKVSFREGLLDPLIIFLLDRFWQLVTFVLDYFWQIIGLFAL